MIKTPDGNGPVVGTRGKEALFLVAERALCDAGDGFEMSIADKSHKFWFFILYFVDVEVAQQGSSCQKCFFLGGVSFQPLKRSDLVLVACFDLEGVVCIHNFVFLAFWANF